MISIIAVYQLLASSLWSFAPSLGGQVGPVPEFFGFGLNVNLLYVPFSKMLCIIYYSVYMYIYV